MYKFGFYNSSTKLWIDDDFNLVASYLLSQSAVVGSGDLLATAPLSGMTVNVAAGKGFFETEGTEVDFVKRFFESTTTVSVAIAASDPTNPRWDIVCVKFDLVSKTAIIVSSSLDTNCKGTPSGTPSIPTTPTNYYKLANVYVPAASTSVTGPNIYDTRIKIDSLDNKTITDSDIINSDIDDATIHDSVITDTTIGAGVKLITGYDPMFTYFGMSRQAQINSNFDIWQRGTTFTNPAASTFTADMWALTNALDGWTAPTSLVHSRLAISENDLYNSRYAYRITTNGAGSGTMGATTQYSLYTRIENGVRLLAGSGKQVTVSIKARSSISGKRIGFNFSQRYGTGGSPTANETLGGEIFTLTSTFATYSKTFTTNTLVGKTFGSNNDDYLQLRLELAWSATFGAGQFGGSPTQETWGGAGTIDIAQVQITAGDTVLTFDPQPVSLEEALCRRYYREEEVRDEGYMSGGFGTAFRVNFGIPMRTTPTVVVTSVGSLNMTGSPTAGELGAGFITIFWSKDGSTGAYYWKALAKCSATMG